MTTQEKIYPRDKESRPYQARSRKPVDFNGLPDEALLRLPDVLRVVPVGRSRWLQGVEDGEYPKNVKISTRAVGWRWGEIRKLLLSFGGNDEDGGAA